MTRYLLIRDIDMRWHKIKLLVVKNRIMIIWAAAFALWVFSFVLGLILLNRIQIIVDRIEESQKSNVCILFIKPEEWTTTNVGQCVENNQSDPNDNFEFRDDKNNLQGTQTTKVTSEPKYQEKPLAVVESSPTEKPEVVAPPVIEKQTRKIIQRINSVTNKVECILEGDTIWQEGTCQ